MTLDPNRKSEEKIMKKVIPIRLAVVVMAFCLPLISNSASAQQEKGKEAATTEQKPGVAYRIEFNVREIEDGKRLNSRNFMMMAEDDDWGKFRVGAKAPYQTSEHTFSLQDVGMSIDCRPHEQQDSVALAIHVEFSSVVPQTEVAPTAVLPQTEAAPTFKPVVVRTVRTEVESIVKPGKPTVVASMDDVISNRHYEIEVTATKVK
jgi:hypothetical protein